MTNSCKLERKRAYARKYSDRILKENKEKYGVAQHPSYIKRHYGCSMEEYAERMATSDCCEICGSKKKLCYDHCHDTGEFRGVLCRTCNSGLGQLGDTVEDVQRTLNYLLKELKYDRG